MSRRLPPLNALRAFDAAGRHESFTRAAGELGVSHSSISRHVRGLEDRLNVRLFRDQSRGVELTAAGARYLAVVSSALDQIAEATEALTERPSGTLVVNSEPFFAAKWLVPRLGDFHRANPGIELRLEATETLIDVARYEADLAIRFRESGTPDPDADVISTAPLYPYAVQGLIDQGIKAPRDLLRFPLLQDRGGTPWAEWFELAGGVTPEEVPYNAWRMRAGLAYEAALAGQGVFLAGADIVEGASTAGQLVRCFDIPLSKGAYVLLQGGTARRLKAARAFRSWLIEASRDLRQ